MGCGALLAKGKISGSKVACKCKRIYIKEGNVYRRARLEEA